MQNLSDAVGQRRFAKLCQTQLFAILRLEAQTDHVCVCVPILDQFRTLGPVLPGLAVLGTYVR